MRCPFCDNQLKKVKTKGVVVDYCMRCKGIWFDSDEFLTVAKKVSSEMKDVDGARVLFEPIKVTSVKVEKDVRLCPRCNSGMKKFNYAYDSNVILDRCTSCSGIWADDGEIQKVAQYLKKDKRTDEIGSELVKRDQVLDDLIEIGSVWKDSHYAFLYLPRIVIPLSDSQPRERIPFVTIGLILLCVLVYIGTVLWVEDLYGFYIEYGHMPSQFFSSGLVSSMFLHGGIIHLLGNMYFFWLFGDNVEDRFSRVGYLLFFLICGVMGDVLHSVVNWGSNVPCIGASGAISGIMGAYLVFYPKAKVKLFYMYRVIELSAVFYIGGWFLLQLYSGILYTSLDVSNVGWFAHIGGFLFGCIIAYFVKKAQNQVKAISSE